MPILKVYVISIGGGEAGPKFANPRKFNSLIADSDFEARKI